MPIKYEPAVEYDSHPYTIVKHELDSLKPVGWMWEEFCLQNEYCSEYDWHTQFDTSKPHILTSNIDAYRNIRQIYAKDVE